MAVLPQAKYSTIKDFFKVLNKLRDEGILINKKDFTCQIGEWLVETIYKGKRAKSAIQKGWDVKVGGKHIQVKAHAKAATNKARFTTVNKDSTERIDELIIIVFTFDYKLKEFFKIPWAKAMPLIKSSGDKKPRSKINWSDIKGFKIDCRSLPGQEIIKHFYK